MSISYTGNANAEETLILQKSEFVPWCEWSMRVGPKENFLMMEVRSQSSLHPCRLCLQSLDQWPGRVALVVGGSNDM
eukprot:5015471-Amphidinium_carterae.1